MLLCWLSGKESACNAGDTRNRFDPWVGKIPWRGNDNLLQYSCLENSGGLQSMRSQRDRHDWAHTHTHTHTHSRMITATKSQVIETENRIDCQEVGRGRNREI